MFKRCRGEMLWAGREFFVRSLLRRTLVLLKITHQPEIYITALKLNNQYV